MAAMLNGCRSPLLFMFFRAFESEIEVMFFCLCVMEKGCLGMGGAVADSVCVVGDFLPIDAERKGIDFFRLPAFDDFMSPFLVLWERKIGIWFVFKGRFQRRLGGMDQ